MKRMTIVAAIGLALAALPAAPATAGAARTFVSPTGSDSNNCSLLAPCRYLQAALAQTNAGGEIAVLGTAGYNNGATVTINQAISIVNPGGFEAGIAVPSSGIGIVINAGATDAVSLRGLTIEGGGVGYTGILFNTGKSLTIENIVIRHVVLYGINFIPNATSSLAVSNSVTSDNGDTGIYVFPSGSSAVTAIFNRIETNNNGVYGIFIDGSNSTGTFKGTASDSIATGNSGTGFLALTSSGKAAVTLMLVRSVAANNFGGLYAQGPSATIRLANSTVTGNTSGWNTDSGAVVVSYGDNYIDGNAADETAPPSTARK